MAGNITGVQMRIQSIILNVPYTGYKIHFPTFALAPDTQKLLAPTVG